MGKDFLCGLVDLFNREIINYSTVKNKDTILVRKALSHVNVSIEKIQIFHTDCGNKFKNKILNETLKTFHIKHSLNMKYFPYDNVVVETILKSSKRNF